jgi:TatD DNase family protein
MIDTHAHVHLPHYDADRETVLTGNFAVGLTGLIEINIARRDWWAVKRLVEADPRIVGTVGIHPHEARRETLADLRALEPELQHAGVVAVGETGLDTFRDYAPLEDQRRLFRHQIGWARESGLPLVLHCRNAFPEMFALIDEEGRGRVRGVFHCFSGDREQLREVLARGFHVGLGGAVTYAPGRWRDLLPILPRERILFETDCPYLRPAPDRKGRNEPAFVFATAEFVAGLLGQEPEALIGQADANAAALFSLPKTLLAAVADGEVRSPVDGRSERTP